jgi:AcrR family transcriptional regulator
MSRPATDKRERLADAALDLAYRRGFERASIADIAAHAGVASGSVYYYFKTKDDVGRAIVDGLSERYLSVVEDWRKLPSPEDRLVAFLGMYLDDADNVRAFGCPLGAVSAELGKHSPELGAAAGEVFAVIQGAAALTHAIGTDEPLQREAAHLERWIRKAGE